MPKTRKTTPILPVAVLAKLRCQDIVVELPAADKPWDEGTIGVFALFLFLSALLGTLVYVLMLVGLLVN